MVQPDFIIIPTQILTDKSLKPLDQKLFGYIYWLSKLKSEKCTASNDTLAELASASASGVKDSLCRLEKSGWISKVMRNKNEREEIKCNVSYAKEVNAVIPQEASSIHDTAAEVSSNEDASVVNPRRQVSSNEAQNNNIYNNNINNIISANADVQPPASPPKTSRPLFLELVQILGFSDKTLYSDKRRGKLSSRLKQYSVDDLKTAATALANDAFMQGDNPGGKRWGTIDYLLRSDEIVEKYLLNQPVGAANKQLYDDNGNYIGGWDNATGGSGYV